MEDFQLKMFKSKLMGDHGTPKQGHSQRGGGSWENVPLPSGKNVIEYYVAMCMCPGTTEAKKKVYEFFWG